MTGSEALYFDTLTIWLIGLAIICAGAGVWGVLRALITVSQLTQAIVNLVHQNYSQLQINNAPIIMKPLVSSVEQLKTTLQARDDDHAKQLVEVQSQVDKAKGEGAKNLSSLKEENQKLAAISHELGQAHARLSRDLNQLEDIQRSLLPPLHVKDKELSIQTYYQPNGKTGGDYYDFILASENEAYLAIADVSGHGSPAAFIMGITRALLHSEIQHHQSPAEILQSLNDYLIRSIRSNEFVTMFLGRLDRANNQFTFSNAGHLPPLWLKAQEREINDLEESRGVPLGVLEQPQFDETGIQITPTNKIVLYTDGVVELFNNKRETYGEKRFRSVLTDNVEANSVDLLDLVTQDMQLFLERDLDVLPAEDDMTVVVFSVDEKRPDNPDH